MSKRKCVLLYAGLISWTIVLIVCYIAFLKNGQSKEIKSFFEAIQNNDVEVIEQYIGEPALIKLDDELDYEKNYDAFFSRFAYAVIMDESYFDEMMFTATIKIKAKDASVYLEKYKELIKRNLNEANSVKNEELFYSALNSCKKTVTTKTILTGFKNPDGSWSIYPAENFADAIYGGLISELE